MLPLWKKEIVLKIKKSMELGKKLSFIHAPKCGGCYASQYISQCNINNKGHNIVNSNDDLTFAIIRDPIKRFESLLNYRLGEKKPRIDFPKRLRHVHFNKSITLNEIISELTFHDIKNLTPYKSLVYWCKNVDLLITIDELKETLELLGYTIDNSNFQDINVSIKERGTLNEKSKKKITEFYKEDVELYNYWTRKDYM
jgi:hypothetical protein